LGCTALACISEVLGRVVGRGELLCGALVARQAMDRNDLNDRRAVFTLMGELSADVKHILSALDRNQRETEKLRTDFRNETDEIKDRLTKVEKFNTRVITYASVALPILTVAISGGEELLFRALM